MNNKMHESLVELIKLLELIQKILEKIEYFSIKLKK